MLSTLSGLLLASPKPCLFYLITSTLDSSTADDTNVVGSEDGFAEVRLIEIRPVVGVFPRAERSLDALTDDAGNGMISCEQEPLRIRTTSGGCKERARVDRDAIRRAVDVNIVIAFARNQSGIRDLNSELEKCRRHEQVRWYISEDDA